jgi:hypothetical protein
LVDFLHALTDEGFMPEIPTVVPSGLRPGEAKHHSTLTSRQQ